MTPQPPNQAVPFPLERFKSYLEVLARRRLGVKLSRKLSSSDIVQETFLEAHRARDHFRGASEREQAAWLRRILLDRIANAERRLHYQKRDIDRERSLDAALEKSALRLEAWLAAEGPSPSEIASGNERFLQLVDALASLDLEEQEALLLRFCEDLSLEEIGARLGVSRNTVARRLRCGLTSLRAKISRPGRP